MEKDRHRTRPPHGPAPRGSGRVSAPVLGHELAVPCTHTARSRAATPKAPITEETRSPPSAPQRHGSPCSCEMRAAAPRGRAALTPFLDRFHHHPDNNP